MYRMLRNIKFSCEPLIGGQEGEREHYTGAGDCDRGRNEFPSPKDEAHATR